MNIGLEMNVDVDVGVDDNLGLEVNNDYEVDVEIPMGVEVNQVDFTPNINIAVPMGVDVNSNYQMNATPNVNVAVPNSYAYANPSASVNVGGTVGIGATVNPNAAVNVQVAIPNVQVEVNQEAETPFHLCSVPYPVVAPATASCNLIMNIIEPGFGTMVIGCKGLNNVNCCFWVCMGKDYLLF